ncbi:MAG TPA: glucose 1-dehydrogenase [bacterium]|nr:glucose 1-dehydrogenase [bacterium]
MRLRGRVAIVTGGGKGIGRAYSIGLAREGAAVVVADIDAEAARETAGEIIAQEGRATAVSVDVADERSVRAMCAQVGETYGGFNILVNNAALFAVLDRKPFYQISTEEWNRVLAVDLTGMFLCCREAYPHLKARGQGSIINISSTSVFEARNRLAHYVAAKMGVIGLTRALAREMGEDGIRVNAIGPGVTASGTNERITPPEVLASRAAERSLKRVEVPEDLVGAVIFLASDDSAFMTGQLLVVDGGKVFH